METQANSEIREIEPFHIPETDCLIEFGHGIVSREKGKDGNKTKVWMPTHLLQGVEELGLRPDGSKNFIRTGVNREVPPDDPHSIVGGGIMTVTATLEVYEDLLKRGKPPKLIVHNDGRAGFLDKASPDDPSVSEGKFMKRLFEEKLHREYSGQELPEEELTQWGRNTKDDILHGLETALAHECASVSFVGLGIRLPRAEAFYEQIQEEDDRFKDIKVTFLPAEEIVKNIAMRNGREAQWQNVMEKFKSSEGYKRTLQDEEAGTRAIKKGNYGEAIGGVGKT